jgi:hypothetical protein
VAWVVLPARPASAGNIVVDDFDTPDTAELVFNLGNPNPPSAYLVKHTLPEVLGGERDILIEVLGTAKRFSVGAMIGYDPASGIGALQVATSGNPATRIALQYDGEDLADSVENGLVNAQDLSVDLTDGGTNDRFELKFAYSDGVDDRGLDIGIIATSPTGGSLVYWGYVPDSIAPSVFSISFSEFTAQGDASFSNVSSLMFLFNFDGTPNIDIGLDSIKAVPEPSTSALLGIALLVGGAIWLRRRRTVQIV